tara:strand:+ start:488 stop:826 length:339 start_codon:yes stop_codon:yes gene_type:complete
MKNYIEPIKTQLDKKMHMICRTFMLIGTPRETPRYYNFKDFESLTDGGLLKIGSAQNNKLYFEIRTAVSYPDININEFWKQFKEYRTEFLFKNYPTIEQYRINLTKFNNLNK